MSDCSKGGRGKERRERFKLYEYASDGGGALTSYCQDPGS